MFIKDCYLQAQNLVISFPKTNIPPPLLQQLPPTQSSMSNLDLSTPRLFLLRHGETLWSQSGRYTGTTDLPLLPSGSAHILSTAHTIYGPGKLIDPQKLLKVFISPRLRAQQTWEIYQSTLTLAGVESGSGAPRTEVETQTTPLIAEWSYGDYEGLFTSEIRSLRASRGLDQERAWDIWRDGTEGTGGESAESVSKRVNSLIDEIITLQGEAMQSGRKGDIVVVAHGHILRAFVKLWLGLPLKSGIRLMLEPGGVCGLSYSHGKIQERAVLVGMSFPSGT
jgi:broad specificity phosphatase PhoE